MASINTMVKRCMGLAGTGDLNEWQEKFIKNVTERTRNGDDTSKLSEKQVAVLEEIFNRHFAG